MRYVGMYYAYYRDMKREIKIEAKAKGEKTMTKGYIARGRINPKMIVITTGDSRPESMIGPGGYSAKIWKTEAGANRHGTAEKLQGGLLRGGD